LIAKLIDFSCYCGAWFQVSDQISIAEEDDGPEFREVKVAGGEGSTPSSPASKQQTADELKHLKRILLLLITGFPDSGHLSYINQYFSQQGKYVDWRFLPSGWTKTTPGWVVEGYINNVKIGSGKAPTKKGAKIEAVRQALQDMGLIVRRG
jgi:hypothetical protein